MPSRIRIVLTMQDGSVRSGPDARRRLAQLTAWQGSKTDWDRIYRDGLRNKLFSGLTIFRERRGISNTTSQYFQLARRKFSAPPLVRQAQNARNSRVEVGRAVRRVRSFIGENPEPASQARPSGRPAIGIFA